MTVIASKPTIASLSPNAGSPGGGDRITVNGTGFEKGATSVTFGGKPGLDVNVENATKLTVETPPGAIGPVDVVVTTSGGASTPATYTYRMSTPSISLEVQSNSLPYGNVIALIARVTGSAGTGEVEFFNADTNVSLGRVLRDPSGPWLLQQPAKPLGTLRYIARYLGDAGTLQKDSDVVAVAVRARTTTLLLSSSASPIAFGGPVTFTATLSNAVDASGRVQFLRDGTLLGTSPVSDDAATFEVPDLPVGSHQITARYFDDPNNAESAAPAFTQKVEQVATSVVLAISPTPSVFGELVTLTATVTGRAPGGSVEFRNADNALLGTSTLDDQGRAVLQLSDLAPGSYGFTAFYPGDTTNAPRASAAVPHTVNSITTSVALASSLNPSDAGRDISFTARVSPATATGNVVFSIDGSEQPPVAMADGVATFATSLLAAGEHEIVARYAGDATHATAASASLTQTVRALGAVIVRVQSGGRDASFPFSSPTSALNLTVATTGGAGESAPVPLTVGTYSLTVADMRADGFALTGLSCTSGASDLETRTATIMLAAGETVVCTFLAIDARTHTADMIGDFLDARAGILLSHQGDIQRRIDRLNDIAPAAANPVALLTGYLPGIVHGGTLSGAASLGQIERLAGRAQPGRFDMWVDGTYGRMGGGGDFLIGTAGADWLLTSDVLLGGFLQVDRMTQKNAADGSFVSGTGWLAGPYVTARLLEHLYLDMVAAAGASSNSISPYGTYEDGFHTTRFLASAALQGEWTRAAWTFSPRARLGWFSERSGAYVDSLGIAIPSVSTSLGQVAFGPGVSYRFVGDAGIMIDTGLRFDGVAEFGTGAHMDNRGIHGRVETSLGFGFPGGARLGLAASHDGIGKSKRRAVDGKLSLSIPLH